MDSLFPYRIRLTHGYPYICINNICVFGSGFHILCESDGSARLSSILFALCYKLIIWEVFAASAGNKVHSKLGACNHQGITHVITGIAHIHQLDSLQISEMLTDGKHISQHLSGMILIGKTIPYRNSGIFCKLFYHILAKSAILDTIVHSSQNSCSVGNALFLTDLGSGRIQISTSHTKIMCSYLKGTAGSGAGFLKNKCNIFTLVIFGQLTCFFLCFQFCGQIQKIQDLLWCKIFQCQKVSAF